MHAGYPEGKLLQAMAFNMASPAFQAIVPSYRFAAIPKAVRPRPDGRCLLGAAHRQQSCILPLSLTTSRPSLLWRS